MNIRQQVLAQFKKDTADHVMTIIRDTGIDRHIRFRKPGTVCYGFDLITWPGHLCYTGDMGTYVFARTVDMFEFFRIDRKHYPNEPLPINAQYWAEKLLAVDRNGMVREFSSDKFAEAVRQDSEHADAETKERIEAEVLCYSEDGEMAARNAVSEFGGDLFQDFNEHDLKEYTHHFLWCCYALTWAIGIYDEAKSAPVVHEIPLHIPVMPAEVE